LETSNLVCFDGGTYEYVGYSGSSVSPAVIISLGEEGDRHADNTPHHMSVR
jgi:hypothetical protein